jgi:hypothetical protein
LQSGSVTCQMAVPVISLSSGFFNNHNFFYQEPNALAFNKDMCYHLALCLWLIIFHSLHYKSWYIFGGCLINQWQTLKRAVPFTNEGKSAASFCGQVAAGFPDMFCNFYLVKNHKIIKTQQPQKLEKNKHRFGILRISSYVCLTKFKKIKFHLIKLPTDFYWKPSYFLCERA